MVTITEEDIIKPRAPASALTTERLSYMYFTALHITIEQYCIALNFLGSLFLRNFQPFIKLFQQKFLTQNTTHSFSALTARASMDTILGLICQIYKELSPKRYLPLLCWQLQAWVDDCVTVHVRHLYATPIVYYMSGMRVQQIFTKFRPLKTLLYTVIACAHFVNASIINLHSRTICVINLLPSDLTGN